MTYYVSSGTLNPTHSLTQIGPVELGTSVFIALVDDRRIRVHVSATENHKILNTRP